MGQVHVLKLPRENQNWFVAGDWHSFNINLDSFNILLKHARLLPEKHRNLIINGDFIDAPYMMPKNPDFQTWCNRKEGVEDFFLPEFEKEIEWGNQTLDLLQTVFKNIIFIHGNHDQPRLEEFKAKYCPSAYRDHFNIDVKLNLMKRNIGSIAYNDWLDFGDLSITHGQYHGPQAYKKHYDAVGARNVVFSHVHHADCKSFIVRGDTRYAWSLPAMCNLNPHYIKNREQNWANGYGSFIMRPDGKFNFNTHIIINGELGLPTGESLRGSNEKAY